MVVGDKSDRWRRCDKGPAHRIFTGWHPRSFVTGDSRAVKATGVIIRTGRHYRADHTGDGHDRRSERDEHRWSSSSRGLLACGRGGGRQKAE